MDRVGNVRQFIKRECGSRRMRLAFLTVIAVGCAAAWSLPDRKPDAIWDRLDYSQFLLATALTALMAASVAVMASREERRRAVAFRIAAVVLGVVSVLIPWELWAWLWPAMHFTENPWYLVTGTGAHGSDELRIERPPHLYWRGSSRGDLAIVHGDADPFERTITFQTDFEGFRNGTDIRTAEVVFIGDSYTEAGNVPEEETFVKQAARKLGVTVRNLGRAAYSPLAELIVLKKYGLKCEPKTVVWQIAEANDLEESMSFQHWQTTGRARSQIGEQTWSTRAQAWRERSPSHRLFSLLKHRAPWPLEGTFRCADGRTYPVRFLKKPGPEHRPLGNPGWFLISEAISEGAQLLKARGVKLIVVVIPMKIRVLGDRVLLSAEANERLGRDWNLPPVDTLSAQLEGLCSSLGVPFVDATPRLRERTAAGELVFLPFDTHLSAEGHRVVSDLIVAAISKAD